MQHSCQATYLLAFFLLGLDSKLAGQAFQPEFAEPLLNITVPIGRDASFRCLVQNLGGYRVGWVKADTKEIQAIHSHVITHNERVSVSQSDQTIWNLHIKNVQEEDGGWYMCQINTDPMKSQMGYLKVVIPPDIIAEETSGDIVVPEGGTAHIFCRATGVPEPRISWRREDGRDFVMRDTNGTRTKVTVHEAASLTLSKISRTEMGTYLCIASNGVRPTVSKRITIKVTFPPTIQVPNQLIGAALGTDVTLECYVESSPRSINYWLRDSNRNNTIDEFVIPSSTLELRHTYLNELESLMTLTLRQLTAVDFEGYRCVAKNSLGEADSIIRLYEISEPAEINTSPLIAKEDFYSTSTIASDNQYGTVDDSEDEDEVDYVTEVIDKYETYKTHSSTGRNETIHYPTTTSVHEQILSNKVRETVNKSEIENKESGARSSYKLHSYFMNSLPVLFCILCYM